MKMQSAVVRPVVPCKVCGILFVNYNANSDPCDMLFGACACGAWHDLNDFQCKSCITMSVPPVLQVENRDERT